MFVLFYNHSVDGMRAMHVSFMYVLYAKSEETCEPVHAHRLAVAIAFRIHK